MATNYVAAPSAATKKKLGFRSDIQGLRAIAVLLVLAYHSSVSLFSGGYIGVDVFFVVSGFLITTHLLESLQQHGTISFARFYANRARRILPAAFVVLALTLVAAVIWMPPMLIGEVAKGAIATALYVPNVLFARQGTNYLAETAPSVFQHYWSLGIEEQFYLAWPALLLMGYRLFRRSRRAMFFALSCLVALSFALCIGAMQISQPWAFFLLPTRAWELGVGGMVAFAMTTGAHRLKHRGAGLLAWAGLATLALTATTYDATIPFPGYFAAVPVVATAMVIIGGNAGRWAPAKLLSARPLQFIGLISYSLYLVHWPIMVIPEAVAGSTTPFPLWLTLCLGASSVPVAYLLYRFVEEPLRHPGRLSGTRSATTLLATVSASALLVVMSTGIMFWTHQRPLDAGRPVSATGLMADPQGTPFVPSNLRPSLQDAADDLPLLYDNGCQRGFYSVDSSGCLFGANPSAPVVALFGDSHATSWFPALMDLAEAGDIQLDVYAKSSCPSADVPTSRNGAPYAACDTWREGVVQRLRAEEPDVILLGNYAGDYSGDGEVDPDRRWGEGLTRTIDRLPRSSSVAVIADVPDMGETPSTCLSVHIEDASSCAGARFRVISPHLVDVEREATRGAGATYLDFTPYLCNKKSCPAVIGNRLVYRDAHHLTATFSASLSGAVRDALKPLVG